MVCQVDDFKAVFNFYFWPLGGSRAHYPYKVDMVNMLAKNSLFPHPADIYTYYSFSLYIVYFNTVIHPAVFPTPEGHINIIKSSRWAFGSNLSNLNAVLNPLLFLLNHLLNLQVVCWVGNDISKKLRTAFISLSIIPRACRSPLCHSTFKLRWTVMFSQSVLLTTMLLN